MPLHHDVCFSHYELCCFFHFIYFSLRTEQESNLCNRFFKPALYQLSYPSICFQQALIDVLFPHYRIHLHQTILRRERESNPRTFRANCFQDSFLDQPVSLPGVSGWIQTISVLQQQIYSLPRLFNFAALTFYFADEERFELSTPGLTSRSSASR